MKIIADDYKGKWFVLQDEDVGVNYERKEINIEYVVGEGLREHVENCLYYGIPAYIGKDKELIRKIREIEDNLKNNSLKEPDVSIEGVLYDLEAKVLSIPEAKKEIMGYFLSQRQEIIKEIYRLWEEGIKNPQGRTPNELFENIFNLHKKRR